jgi:hypothetical protein
VCSEGIRARLVDDIEPIQFLDEVRGRHAGGGLDLVGNCGSGAAQEVPHLRTDHDVDIGVNDAPDIHRLAATVLNGVDVDGRAGRSDGGFTRCSDPCPAGLGPLLGAFAMRRVDVLMPQAERPLVAIQGSFKQMPARLC